jgi:hypothetical protein
MKALSIHPDPATLILFGQKTIECRTWKTDYRGDILICSTAHKLKNTIPGHAICVVRLADVVPFKREHLDAACKTASTYSRDDYAWILADLRLIKPFAVKGKLSLWNCEENVEIFDGIRPKEEWDEIFKTYYEPLFV